MRRAVVDLGSNSTLLLVAEKTADGWQTVYESSTVTGLGRGTKSTGLLSEEGMRNGLESLANAFEVARKHGVENIRAGGTMAVRLATNTPEFLERAAAQGTPVEVISGDREAELGLLAVLGDPRFSSKERLTIVDPGGHSTEVTAATRSEAGWDKSLQKSLTLGALSLLEGPLADECPGVTDRLRAVEEVDAAIGFEFLPGQAGTVVALGATGTNLVTMREEMATWDPERVHGQWLDYGEISRRFSELCDLTVEERASIAGLEKGREATMPAGALILERLLYALRVEGCFVSVRGWRHAWLECGP